ncbi:hypothetical protein D3C76_796700 [compost metagenome]
MGGDERGIEGEVHILVGGQGIEGDRVFGSAADFAHPGVGHDIPAFARVFRGSGGGQSAGAVGQVARLQGAIGFTEDDGLDQFELRLADLQFGGVL